MLPDSCENNTEFITTERVGLVVHRLTLGESATTLEIAAWTGLTRFGAWEMLDKLTRVIPLTLIDGRWRCVNRDAI